MFRFLLVITVGILLALLSGCEGETRHDIHTGGNGTLLGLVISPEPQSLDVPTDQVFHLDWVNGYEPPQEFTVSLKAIHADGSTDPILTTLDEIDPGHYRLEPTFYLSTETFLLLTVSTTDERQRAIYLTQSSSAFDTKTMRRAGGQAEHTVTRK